MPTSDRFRGPASGVNLGHLLNKGLRLTAICLATAALVHVVAITRPFELATEKAARPLTTRFVQRRPRLTKPMELRKKPKPRQRKMVRQEVRVQARVTRLLTTEVGGISLRSLGVPEVRLDAGADLVTIDLGGRSTDIGITTSKEPENKIDMREQLLDLNFLDTGKYQAMVIQDPDDKQSIQGYFHVAQAYSARMAEHNLRRAVGGDSRITMLQNPQAVQNVVDALNEYTSIHADFSARLPLSSRELLETPWVFVPSVQFVLSDGELQNLGRYLEAGGFIVADAGSSVGSQTDAFIREMIKDALATVGRQARFERLPNDHPVYHCFFDFDSPPRAIVGMGGGGAGEGRGNPDYLVGVEVDDRLAVLISYQRLGVGWENIPGRNTVKDYTDNSRLLQFGINTIVFALTQEGSITNRVMQTVR